MHGEARKKKTDYRERVQSEAELPPVVFVQMN